MICRHPPLRGGPFQLSLKKKIGYARRNRLKLRCLTCNRRFFETFDFGQNGRLQRFGRYRLHVSVQRRDCSIDYCDVMRVFLSSRSVVLKRRIDYGGCGGCNRFQNSRATTIEVYENNGDFVNLIRFHCYACGQNDTMLSFLFTKYGKQFM
ncbi:hypothetical protein niasHT_001372 [Heterodera trifolii]|uniref:Uncharacterized protein n=1 Tax=Heterodera trifolii TaxID=157864 RepID=A0ABD2LN03_9BILA